ncbi:endonuclease/exonuclease/phosphatase family protein [Bifidobacterium avesanii]|nr:endonuclease/exonuclease/phosphatase family protein [Bifidobacterium avesanii]KAB8290092.1 endonuclease/exonuclease/phosphatase [Bifidobacterium avesanii]
MTEYQFDFQRKRAEQEHAQQEHSQQAGARDDVAATRAMSPIDDELNGVWQTRPMPTERVLPDQPTVPIVHDFAQTQSMPAIAGQEPQRPQARLEEPTQVLFPQPATANEVSTGGDDDEATQVMPSAGPQASPSAEVTQVMPATAQTRPGPAEEATQILPTQSAADAAYAAMPTRPIARPIAQSPAAGRTRPMPQRPQYAPQPAPQQPQSSAVAQPFPNAMNTGDESMPPSSASAAAPARPRRRNWFLRGGKHGFLSFWLWLVTFALMALMSIRFIPGLDMDGRALPELIAFLPVAGVISAGIAVLAFWWRRWLLTAVSVACVVLQFSWHMGYFIPAAQLSSEARAAVAAEPVATDDAYARIMTLNAREGKADAASIVQLVTDEHVEVLALQEVNDDLLQRLSDAGIAKVLPHRVVGESGNSDNGGVNVLYTKASMSRPSSNLLRIETSAMSAGTVTMGGHQVRFVSAHPNSPTRGKQGLWGAGLGTIGDLKDYDWTYVIMGDFNSTWDHPRFRELLGDRFVDASEQAGRGYHFTYPSNVEVHGVTVPSVIEIDHIIHDKGVTMGDLTTVTVPGSDHKALLATMQVD